MYSKIDYVRIIVFGGIWLLFTIVAISPGFIRWSSIHRGSHNGYITAVEQEGYVWPNYRVYVKTDNSSSQENVYCMDRSKTELAEKLKKASHDREKITVIYDGVRGIGMDLCSGEQILDIK